MDEVHVEREQLDFFLSHGVKRVLDVGCGRGGELRVLRGSGFDAVGVDKSGEFRGEGVVVAPAERLPFPDESFDAVFSFGTLMLTDVSRSVPEIVRVLRPGGVAFLSVFCELWIDGSKVSEYRVDRFRKEVEARFRVVRKGFRNLDSDSKRLLLYQYYLERV